MKSFLWHAVGIAGLTSMSWADDPIPARVGLQQLEDRFGRPAIQRIFEMIGSTGDPQPLEWRVTAHDPKHPDLLHEYEIQAHRASDEGLNDDYYPDRLPKGFFSLSRLKLDSTQAFAIAEQVARDGGIGFDSVNYKLHCREYSDEPVWTLTLLDKEEVIVGSVHLSADSGKILRTVWLRRLANGRLSVVDSAVGAKPKPLAALEPDSENDSRPAEASAAPVTPGEPGEPGEPGDSDGEKAAPSPAPSPAEPNPPAADDEVPEIKRLNEAQERNQPAKR